MPRVAPRLTDRVLPLMALDYNVLPARAPTFAEDLFFLPACSLLILARILAKDAGKRPHRGRETAMIEGRIRERGESDG